MAITITCPFCSEPAEIDEAYLGKKLRCAEPNCRKAFRITPDGHALPVAEKGKSPKLDWSSQPPPPVQGGAADWQAAPPPVGGGYTAPLADDYPGQPYAAEPYGEAQYAEGQYAEEGEDGETTYEATEGHYYGSYPKKSNKGKIIAISMILVLLVGAIAAAFVFMSKTKSNKEQLEQQAEQLVSQEQWSRAKEAFGKLAQQFPNSADTKRYDFFQKWIELQTELSGETPEKLKAAETGLQSFYDTYRTEDIYRDKGFRSRVWATAVKIADQAATRADQDADPTLLATAERCLKIANDTQAGEKDEAAAQKKQEEIEAKVGQAREAIATSEAARKVSDEISRVQRSKQPQGIERAQAAYTQALQQHPRLTQNTELVGKLDRLRAEEPTWVLYKALSEEAQKPKDETEAASLLVSPPIKVAPETVESEGVVLAVARGTVYGLSAKNGEPRWAMRVGVDTQGLPARLPTRRGQADLALILSQNESNQTLLNAVNVNTGQRLWYRTLSAPCPAGPLLVGFRAYVPTLDGKLSIINVADGKLVGVFDTGARLTVPLGYDRKNNVLYAPADAKRIFVFDLAKNRCTDVIYTNHAAGLLRGAPVVAGHSRLSGATADAAGDAGAQSTFVLAEGTGLGGLKVRIFPCQAKGKDNKPISEFTLPGQSWFTPYFDGDQLGLVTDKGYLAVWGVNRDTGDTQPLSALTEGLIPGIHPPGAEASNVQPKGRAQVVFVALNQWWVLVDNKLMHLRLDPYRKQWVPVPGLTVELGSPLHEATLSPDGKLVVVVSLSPDRRILATALDRVTGATVWQRQLGLVPTQDSVSLGNQVLTVDKSGALFLVDSRQVPPKLDIPWLSVGDWLTGNVKGMSYARLMVTPSGKSAICLAYNPTAQQVTLRRYEPGRGITADRTYRLASPPAGAVAVSDEGSVIIPCRDGKMHEFNINSPAASRLVADWRTPTASPTATGHALLVSNKELLASDGQRRIQRWERTDNKDWVQVKAADLNLPGKIMTPLLAVTDAGQPGVMVGDDSGKLHLFGVGNLPSQREWEVKGTITRGPFRVGPTRVGCVADQRRMIWLDLAGPDGQFLEFDVASAGDPEAGIVGQPQAVGDFLLIPELSGKFLWLNLATGDPASAPVQLAGSLVPASGAVPLGNAWSFAPLSDGTVMLLPQPKKAQ